MLNCLYPIAYSKLPSRFFVDLVLLVQNKNMALDSHLKQNTIGWSQLGGNNHPQVLAFSKTKPNKAGFMLSNTKVI